MVKLEINISQDLAESWQELAKILGFSLASYLQEMVQEMLKTKLEEMKKQFE